MQDGWNALVSQLDKYRTGASKHTSGKETLLEAMKIYAPKKDGNDPVGYANNIATNLGISVNTPIKDISAQDWAKEVARMESSQGFKELQRLGII